MDNLPHSAGLGQTEQQSRITALSTKELVEQLIDFGRRQYPIIVIIAASVVALGLVYLFTAQRQYTAHATLLIDTTKMQVLQQQQQVIGELPLDTAQVETQIEVLKSDAIGLSVVKDLKLTKNPEFVGSQTGLIGAAFGLISSLFSSDIATSHGVASEDALTRAALGRFKGNRDIKRIPRTYALDISYTSLNPDTAATVANAIADAYLTDQLDAKYQASRRASKWLQDRIGELRDQAMAADRAVLEFKEQKNLVEVGSQNGSGPLLGDQRVVDLNTAVAKARADTDEAKARLDRIQKIMAEDVPDAAVTDSLNNSVINQLRTQYLEDDRRYHIFAAKYGEQHLAVINLKTQMDELRRSMADELARIAQSYKSNYEISKSREESLEKSLSQQISGAQLSNRELVGLDELQSKAKAYHAIHDSFLQRYMEVTQQQSLPITEARVITAATAPGGPSSPHTSRILFLSGVLGLMLALGAAWTRESFDRVFRTAKQVEQILKANCLAVIPMVHKATTASPVSRGVQKSSAKRLESTKELSTGLFRHVIDEPLSAFAEGFRAIKVAADITGSISKNKVFGVTSSLPHEGKSTVSSNFAEIIAAGGKKVILIDGDLRNPSLTHRVAPNADVGLLEVLSGRIELSRVIQADHQTGLAFLPAVVRTRTPHSSDILASDAFAQLVERLRNSYDFVVIDLSPLAPIVDVRATTHFIDSYLFVIEWGRTRLNMVQRQAGSASEVFDRLLGVVLNKANTKVMDRYDDYYGRYYYKNNYYARYGDVS
jgi:polysaccharide biosynthesis transport protein